MDSTQALVDGLRFKIRFYPFTRMRFWFGPIVIAVWAGALTLLLRYLLA
jgi:hypothetical protein